ncbi:MAG TPA: hypothetical protein VLN08_01830, partial [Vicinamibacterales bacterium]|nr:hypothetical protein [Vicinamibacterales bacterium]
MFRSSHAAVATRRPRPAVWATTLLALLLIGALPGIAGAQSGIISTVAGTGAYEASGDGGPATAAGIHPPYGLALDAEGNLYIAAYGAHRIRKISAATGIITTVAGTGEVGASGDGGLATLAQLNAPVGVAIGPDGDLYISEVEGARVRRVDGATGIITTVAGTGVKGYNGDGIAATAAQLHSPWGVAVDGSGHLYIADNASHRIRKVDAASGLISTYAGDGVYSYYGDGGLATAAAIRHPLGIGLDATGNLYVADYGNSRIRTVTAATGIISTVAGNGSAGFAGDGGPATAASFSYPYDVQVDLAGNLYIADAQNYRIRYVSAATGLISTVAGSGVQGYSGDGALATAAALDTPIGIAVGPADGFYISDYGNLRIRRVDGRALPVITWADPAGIVYGTALSATHLNATADVAGTFVYDPAAGTVLNAGMGQTL